MTKVYMAPSPKTVGAGVSGIHTVIKSYGRLLPSLGIEFVGDINDADVSVSHAGMGSHSSDVSMLHGIYFTNDYQADPFEWKANRAVIKSVRSCLLATVPSEWVAETFRRDFKIDPIVVPHGVFVDEWEHKFAYKPKTVLWAKNRRWDVCDPTPLNSVASYLPDYTFYATVVAPGAPKNVVEIGVQPEDQMKEWIQRVAMIIGTVKETWGIVYAEALAAGTPVVTVNRGHVPNLVKHGVTGYVYRPENNLDVARGIEWVNKHRPQLSANARLSARSLDWKYSAKRVASVFKLAHRMKLGEVSL